MTASQIKELVEKGLILQTKKPLAELLLAVIGLLGSNADVYQILDYQLDHMPLGQMPLNYFGLIEYIVEFITYTNSRQVREKLMCFSIIEGSYCLFA